MRVAVFSPNLIGDTVMATPAFRALRRGLPEASLTLVIKPGVAATLDGAPWFDGRILFDPRSKRREHRTLSSVRQLRRGRFDLAVLFPNSIRTGLVATLGGCRRRVGYDRGGRAPFLTDRLLPIRAADGSFSPVPAVESYLAIVRQLGLPVDSVRTELFTTEADERLTDAAWSRLGLPLQGRVVCLNTGGAFGPAKAWPAEYFADLARRLADQAGASVLVLCGPAEREAVRVIVAGAAHPRVVSLADEALSLGLSKACVRRSALLVTTDSGPRHFAAAFGVPVVSLFGPTHIAWTRTYHPQAVHLRVPVPCGPCQSPTCAPGHHRCMKELTPEAVFFASSRLLGRPASPDRVDSPTPEVAIPAA